MRKKQEGVYAEIGRIKMKDRVMRDHVDLNYRDVQKFFDERGGNDELKNK